jgi:hypothetical protein
MSVFDRSILSLINQFAHHSPTFDQFVVLLSTSNFLKESVVLEPMQASKLQAHFARSVFLNPTDRCRR